MRYFAYTSSNESMELKNPVSVSIQMDESVPADSLEAVFLLEISKSDATALLPEELNSIKVYNDDSNKLVFNGIVDEQEVKCSSDGVFLKICARSMAALLLDNEARAQIYYRSSLGLIFERHIYPYGFSSYKGSDILFSGEFQVSKGMSEWEVLRNFCASYLDITPRLNTNGVIDATGNIGSNTVIFSNNTNGAIKYRSIAENIRRSKLISEVLIRCQKDSDYNTRIYDDEVINKNIIRKRYLNAVNLSGSYTLKGEQIIEKAKIDSYETRISAIGGVDFEIGDLAYVDDRIIGYKKNLIVSEINYQLSSSGEFSEVSLRLNI